MWRRVSKTNLPSTLLPETIMTEDIDFLFKSSREVNLKKDFYIELSQPTTILFVSEDKSITVKISRFATQGGYHYLSQYIRRYVDGAPASTRTIYYRLETPEEEHKRKRDHGDLPSFGKNW